MDFSFHGFIKGFRAGLPIAVGVASYGLVFGVLSRQAGLETLHALAMSAFVFAGASQFVALDLWVSPLPVITLIVTTFVVNMRHMLMGAVLPERFSGMTRFWTCVSLFFMVDESWACSLNEWRHGNKNAALLLGIGFALFFAWTLSTVAGSAIGSAGIDPVRWGMDFAFTAIFIFLATGMWRGKRDMVPWIVAAATAVFISRYFPGKWYILAGSITGSLTGVVIHDR